jgi:ammonia channel protein AmtB
VKQSKRVFLFKNNFLQVAFVAAKLIGARLGRWDLQGDPPMGSPSNAVIGLFMLWWGWLAFNAGSTFGKCLPDVNKICIQQ